LADAKFFWENDLRVAQGDGLTAWTDRLSNVTFHNKLGSQKARIERIASLAATLAPIVGAEGADATLAAQVAKADLSSEMVYEFPELQGLMGRYYATAAGLPDAVAAACQDHYSPLGPSDDVPSAPVSVTVALADKLDTLAGFWAIDEKPTGSKDPFALRRAALGVIRLVLENNVRLSLSDVIAAHLTQSNLSQTAQDLAIDLMAFFHDRLKVFLRDQGIRYDVIEACLSQGDQTDLVLIVERAKALAAVLETDDGINLVQGFKRANNILTQAEQKDGVEYSFGADIKFAEEEVERQLFAALETTTPKIQAALQAQDFAAAMADMAMLRAPIDAFFDGVQVNSDNAIVRRNRLNMLHSIRDLVGQVADLNRIEG